MKSPLFKICITLAAVTGALLLSGASAPNTITPPTAGTANLTVKPVATGKIETAPGRIIQVTKFTVDEQVYLLFESEKGIHAIKL
jgi:hypothetical protein